MTQPQGHSTSGSHERYKSQERLTWESEFDPLRQMRLWLLEHEVASESELDALESEEKKEVRAAQGRAWDRFREPIEGERSELLELLGELASELEESSEVVAVHRALDKQRSAMRRDLLAAAHDGLVASLGHGGGARERLASWRDEKLAAGSERLGSMLHPAGAASALSVDPVAPIYSDDSPVLNGFEVLNHCFDAALAREPRFVAFGQDLGKLGDVNQGFLGMQEKYGAIRVSDVGIRETSIIGQAIGLALRGFRPLAEVQYLDYLLYALQIMSDDLATLSWRTRGQQRAPVIVRTRGHRLEGIWHAGSPMGGVIHLLRGMRICVPRNMTQAAGMYNTLLEAEDPALVVEVLNGYRSKERLPDNVSQMRVGLGLPEVLRKGTDLTIVTYGACCAITLRAAELLASVGVEAEVIDVQTLLPFDIGGRIAESVRNTNRALFVDEDVPGGATAYMLREVVERQGAYVWLDAEPRTVTSTAHRPAYGSDGDYFSKPNRESIFDAAYEMVREAAPGRFPRLT